MEKIDKRDWPDGPWKEELDRMDWQDQATGLSCRVIRISLGHLCGYVGIPKTHSLYGRPDISMDDTIEVLPNFDVHGGITWSAEWGVEEHYGNDLWWVGFDCAHGMDYSPAMEVHMPGFKRAKKYKDVNYVRNQTTSLAQQLSKWVKD